MMKNILLLFTILVSAFSGISQSKIDYDSDSRWFWGFNYGGTWHTSDVKYQINHGWGLTIGKSFNYDYRKVFSFDIRGRYLTGNWYGQNTDSSLIANDYKGIYSNVNSNYKDTFGYSIDNFKSTINRLAVEFVIHANRVKETTKFDPYIFVGAGYTWYTTKTDIINSSSSLYDYSKLSSYSFENISSFRDNNYETEVAIYKPLFMPSVGFGLGYQIGKRVSIGIEHKSTFTQKDDFDGIIKSSKYKQDIYHYSSAYIRFQLKSRNSHNDVVDDVYFSKEEVSEEPVVEQPKLPVVTITNPSRDNEIVSSQNFVLQSTILHISNRDNVIFKQDSISNYNFNYDPSSRIFKSNVILHLGENKFEVRGTNTSGTDVKYITIIYKKEALQPPIVTFKNPLVSPIDVMEKSYNVVANVLNVTDKNQITVKLNNQFLSNFLFDVKMNVVSFQVLLQEGANQIEVKATNTVGSDSKITMLFFKPIKQKIMPIVNITNPSVSPFVSVTNMHELVATVLNVENKQNIEVYVNNQNVDDFSYNLNNKILKLNVNLLDGDNTVLIKANNSEGVAQDDQIITYKTPCYKPILSLMSSSIPNNAKTTNEKLTFVLATENLQFQEQIKVKFNNAIIPFVFDPISKQIKINDYQLTTGVNVFDVLVSSKCGEASFSFKVQKEIVLSSPPSISFINPASCPTKFNLGPNIVKGFVSNIRSNKEVRIFVNNQEINNYSYTFSNGGMNFEFILEVKPDNAKYALVVKATYTSELITNSCLIEGVEPSK